MKIITFNEDDERKEWLEWRKNGITATDISILMGSNPYSTPHKLWEKKCGYQGEEPMNAAMEHGMRSEEYARDWINAQLQLNLRPICIEDTSESIFRASLDGWDSNQKILCEIKAPINESTIERARLQNAIPEHWYDQVLWQILISAPQRAILAVWDYRTQNCHVIDMFPQIKRMEEMKREARKFWNLVKSGIAPEMKKGDYKAIEHDRARILLEEWKDIGEKEKALSDRKKEIKIELEEIAAGENIEVAGYRIYKTDPRKSYNYEQMRLDGIDVDQYAKLGKASYTIRPVSKN